MNSVGGQNGGWLAELGGDGTERRADQVWEGVRCAMGHAEYPLLGPDPL